MPVADHKHVLLTTIRRNGDGVATPVYDAVGIVLSFDDGQ